MSKRARAIWGVCSIWRAAKKCQCLRDGARRCEASTHFPAEWHKLPTTFPSFLCRPHRVPEHKRAVDYLVERLRNAPTPVQILVLGPLTNIAENARARPVVQGNISEIVLMGGAVKVPGNLQDGGVFHHQEQHCRMEHLYRSAGSQYCFSFGRADPFDRAGCDQQSSYRRPIPARVRIEGASAAGTRGGRSAEGRSRNDRRRALLRVGSSSRRGIARPSVVKIAAMDIDIRQNPPQEGRTMAVSGPPNTKVAIDADAAAFRAFFLDSFAHEPQS